MCPRNSSDVSSFNWGLSPIFQTSYVVSVSLGGQEISVFLLTLLIIDVPYFLFLWHKMLYS